MALKPDIPWTTSQRKEAGIQQYGPEDALLFAPKRADVLLELGESWTTNLNQGSHGSSHQGNLDSDDRGKGR
jgi:hypothetical protein